MKKYVFVLGLALISVSVFAGKGGDKVDRIIEEKFHKQFGTTLAVTWKIINDISIASYTEQGEQKQAFYFNDGELFGLGKNIKLNELPVSVRENFANRFSEANVLRSYEFKTANSPTRYFLEVLRNKKLLVVSANEFGDFRIEQKTR